MFLFLHNFEMFSIGFVEKLKMLPTVATVYDFLDRMWPKTLIFF